jgi:hypothetical protein
MRPPSIVALVALLLAVVAAPAVAGPKGKTKKYHFHLSDVTAGDGVTGDIVDFAQPRVKAQVEKAFANHPQLVATLEGAPDPATDAKGYKDYLKKKKLAGAYKVNVEITLATEELETVEGKPGTQRLVVRLGIKAFGETIPERVMGFSGEGSATIKQEVGKKVRARDREFAWDSAAELAINDAIATSLAKLALPPAKPSKK